MITTPIFFERNRVGRVYTGGKLFHGLFGDAPEDNFKPEEWIASNVKAINKGSTIYKEGVSRLLDSDVWFDELLEKYPDELLGKGNTLRILVKALDSAIRLPAQAHPDKAFSRKHFNSNYGKTECWIILDTRPDAKLFFGFRDGVDRDAFQKAIDDSESDLDAMERLMEEITPKVGEVYFVPARTVHAIGRGCLILEVQEPTDFTIQPERYCGEYRLSDEEMYLGLSRDTAVDCFDFVKAPDSKLPPRVVERGEGFETEALVDSTNTDCFIINRIKLSGGSRTLKVDGSYAIYIVTDGEGRLSGKDYTRDIKKGDYFFMPASLMGEFSVSGNAEIVECY
ncbi:MAG: class I mannose-6-phosphate isomerase [Clostridia bacterium]|nr:class I mannose-6-phosphate isomerase [Clostridia bacterium]